MNKIFNLLLLGAFAIVAFFCNIYFLQYYNNQLIESKLHYSLHYIYTFFFVASFTLICVLETAAKRFFDSLGYIFMALTTTKMITTLFWFISITKNHSLEGEIEKINFFIVFVLFLAVETVLSIRILNRKG
jgi:hypothetical protein